jgi:diguanylate cyclase (GGDEF)-like protein
MSTSSALMPSGPEQFLVSVTNELRESTARQRWRDLNVILQLATISGSQMQLDPSLQLLCDSAEKIVRAELCHLYYWSERDDRPVLRLCHPRKALTCAKHHHVSRFNVWAIQYGRPLLITQGLDDDADQELATLSASSALVVPLFVRSRVAGSLQLLSARPNAFTAQDAQMLWLLVLAAENLLTREEANEGLLHFAFTDFLTGLHTRGYFEQQLDMEVKRSDRKGLTFSLLMLDLDHFKELNDTYGHHVGDRVLRAVSQELLTDMREVDTVARYGGEEFVIILPETTQREALNVAQRVRSAVERASFRIESLPPETRLTISIGLALYRADAQNRSELIEFADSALYAAKSRGRNQVVCYSDLMRQQRREVS